MQNESFREWVDRIAKASGYELAVVREHAGIRERRWRHLLRVGGPSSEEAEDIATEGFGLFPGEAYTSPRYNDATNFRRFLASQGREEYRFPRLWPQVLENLAYRTDGSSDTMTIAVFREVLEADKDSDSW